jgi:uncharacterized membrane protein YbhN (UPF0104 family)
VTLLLASHAIALALVIVEALLRAWRLGLLIPAPRRPGFWRNFAANAYGDALSVVTPARLGGDPARFLTLRRSGTGSAAALVALGAEQAIDWLVLTVAAVVLAAAFGREGVSGVSAIVHRLTTVNYRPWLGGAAVLAVVGAVGARWYQRRHPGALRQSARRAVESVRALPAGSVAAATATTAVCVALRVAVLPVLCAPYHARSALGAVILGSFGLVYGQMLLPTPAGAGGVDLGFVAGFAGSLTGPQVAGLLLAWRAYTTGFDLLLGAGLFGWSLWTGRARPAASPGPTASDA